MKKYLILLMTIVMAASLVHACFALPFAADDFSALMSENTLATSSEEEVTVGQLATAAARLDSILSGDVNDAKLFENSCLEYALSKGIMSQEELSVPSASATRRQAVLVLYKVVSGKIDLRKMNDISDIYDADVAAEYYEAALCFMRAGIIDGKNKYGAFRPGNSVKRYELSDMIDRLLDESLRVRNEYLEYAEDEPYYLIDDFLMLWVDDIGSGWRYDYTGSTLKGDVGSHVDKLTDLSLTDNVSMKRTIEVQTEGVLQLESNFRMNYGFEGLEYALLDSFGNDVYVFGTTAGEKFFNGEIGNATYISKDDREIPGEDHRIKDRVPFRVEIDLDEHIARAFVAGKEIGTAYDFVDFKDVAALEIRTGEHERLEAQIMQVHLSRNYRVNDLMRVEMPEVTYNGTVYNGQKPLGYDASSNLVIKNILSQADNQGDNWSAKFTATSGVTSYANKSFKAASGKVVAETMMLLPEGGDGAYYELTSDGETIFKVETKNGYFYAGDTKLLGFRNNVWQLVRIEADLEKNVATVKIRGKIAAENIPLVAKAQYINGLSIGAPAGINMWFDDVEVFETFERDDYVPEPTPLENDYLVGMSVCNLWRNGSHRGWSYIQPHHEPITGFYDEGFAEAMDWEIKFLVEHGFDFYNFCWYSGQGNPTDPLKKSRMNDAIHDGYFNAKYSDMLKISLMFENASMREPGSLQAFKDNVWPYWVDYYFSDPRYFTIKEDGKTYTFLTIYKYEYFLQMCNSDNLLTSSGGLDRNKVKSTHTANAAEVLKWMNDQLIAEGISDGIIVGFNDSGSRDDSVSHISQMSAKIGRDRVGIFPYTWGSEAEDLEVQKSLIERSYQTSKNGNVDLLALPCIGFNKIGWYFENNYDLISNEDLRALLTWLKDDYMPRYKNDSASWKQKFIQFATWNEYGEGHYFYPCDDNGGYDYLDIMAEILSGDKDSEDNNTIPTEAQKDRIGHLFVGDRLYIRRNFHEREEVPDSVTPISSMSWKYTPGTALSTKNKSMYDGWTLGQLTEGGTKSSCTNTGWIHVNITKHKSGCTYDNYYNGVLTSTTTDPMLYRTFSTPVPASNMDICYITMESSVPHVKGELFFVSDHHTLTDFDVASDGKRNYTQKYSYNFDIASTEKVTYKIDLNSHSGWIGNIEKIRIDPGNEDGNTIKIHEITFAKLNDDVLKTSITIDGIDYKTIDYAEIRSCDREEVYIAPAESEGLYRLLHIVYDMRPEKDVLMLTLPDDTEIIFTIGSSVVFVDGKKVNLKKPVELFDGVPVIPLIWLLKTGGYNFVYDYTAKTLDVTVVDKIRYYNIDNFDAEGENKNSFYTQDSKTSLSIVTDPYDSTNKVWQLNASSAINGVEHYSYIRADFEWVAGVTYIIDFDARLTGTLANGSAVDSAELSFNARYGDSALDRYDHNPKECRVTLTKDWKHYSMTYTVEDTLDPASTFKPQISFYIPPVNTEGVNMQMDNLRIRTEPLPFKVENPGAEAGDAKPWYSENAVLTSVDKGDGTRYFHIEHNGKSISNWTYIYQRTTFEPGVTYYFSVDVRLGKGSDGSNATTDVTLNARYLDFLRENALTNKNDHTVGLGKFTTSNNWTTVTGSFKVSDGYTPGGTNSGFDEISFFSNPVNSNTVPVAFELDNFIVSTKSEDIFG